MPIPQIIHQTWKGPPETVPSHWRASHQQWRALTDQGWEYKFWTNDDIFRFIEQHYPWFLPKLKSYQLGIQLGDVIRYFVLHHYGGVYADLDLAPKPNFPAFFRLVKDQDLCIASNKNGNDVGSQNLTNAFMMSSPQCAFWPVVWSLLMDPFKVHPWKSVGAQFHYFHVLWTTGPGIVSDAASIYKGSLYRIPPGLTQPGTDQDTYPLSTTESVVTVLEGSSWHQSDAKVWKTLGRVGHNRDWVWGALVLITTVALVFTVVAYYRLQQRVRTPTPPLASHRPAPPEWLQD